MMLNDQLHSQIHSAINEDISLSDERFNDLALALFEHQFAHNLPYQKFCQGLGAINPKHWQQIPCLSTDSFKNQKLFCGNIAQAKKVFFSSGTSQSERSQHYLSQRELELYELSLWKSFSKAFKLPGKFACFALTESPSEKPNSSLIHMFEAVKEKANFVLHGYFMHDGKLQLNSLIERLNEIIELQLPVLIVGTAFAFVQFIDAVGQKFKLPDGSAIMETGGFKGKSRAVSKNELYASLGELFGLPRQNLVGQYGMSELGVQFYDSSFLLNSDSPEARYKVAPNWARTRIVDPSDLLREMKVGEIGLLCHYDLTNIDSCAFILSGDLGLKRGENSFELIGRAAELSAKGCSLNYELE